MASFHNIIENGLIDISHRGETANFEIADWHKKLKGILFDEEALIAWAREYEIVIPVFHYFVQQLHIAIRATSRPKMKNLIDMSIPRASGEKEKIAEALKKLEQKTAKLAYAEGYEVEDYFIDKKLGDVSLKITADLNVQDRINDLVIKAIPLPGESKAKTVKAADERAAAKAVKAMLDNNIEPEMVHTILDKDFGKAVVALSINDYIEE